MKRGSLRLRLFAAGAASVLLALALAGGGLLWLFERHVERRVALELESNIRELVAGLGRDADGTLTASRSLSDPRFGEPLSGLYWQIAASPADIVLRSRSLWDATLDLPPDTLHGGEVHRHIVQGPGGASLLAVERWVSLPASLGGGRLRVAAAIDRKDLAVATRAFGADLLPALGLLALVLIAAAWAQVTIGLRPLDAVRRRLGAVRAGHAPRLGAGFPDEVLPLAAEVDTLLEVQEQAIARARTRAADLAHGLKTPLTVLAATAGELRRRGDAAAADEIAEVVGVMLRHVERELARSRAMSRLSGRAAPPLGVRTVAERIVRVLRRTPRGQDLEWRIDVADDLRVAGDAEDLAEILGNLTENAVKWARTKVCVSGRSEMGAVVLIVEDDGPGIPTDAVGTALLRGTRLDETQPGTGLGLAIVNDLAEAYGGPLVLGRSLLGGLKAAIRLPAPQ